ncbi:hypothetical protein VTJ83DRAFT_2334 [Remersonia thermophila]|uniref:Mid2 domain-containing protein n=1 Tax=Remersonia thermophila TaxID=72144 RepID=A0ABR4DJ20_9PEZI
MPRCRWTLWVASLLAARAAAAAVIPFHDVFARQSTCAPNHSQCQHDGFPDYFCCPSGQTCIPLAGNTTLLCCPKGSTCQVIEPVPCDLSLQNGERHPDAVIKTTVLGGTLKRCGGQCCPFGYSCNGNECVMDEDQNAVPIQTTRPTSTRRVEPPTATSSSAADPTNTPDESDETEESNDSEGVDSGDETSAPSDAENTSSGPPVAAIAGGVVAGVVVLLIAAVAAFLLLRKKGKLPDALGGKRGSDGGKGSKFSRSTSSFGNLISNPIVSEHSTFRTDFARGSPPQRSLSTKTAVGDPEQPDSVTGAVIDSKFNSPATGAIGQAYSTMPPIAAQMMGQQQQQQQQQPYQAYRPGTGAGGGGGGGGYAGGYGALDPPQTPSGQQHREPSSVSINVFADPNITPDRTPESSGGNRNGRYSTNTTFTQMLDSADLGGIARGESYVGYNPTTPPMPRRLL